MDLKNMKVLEGMALMELNLKKMVAAKRKMFLDNVKMKKHIFYD